jgi:ATP-binding cassette subfamily F protein uup
VALAQALVARPDVLLLDEPTNHLDLDAIEWLEDLLLGFKGSVVTITHDRAFLDRVATRIVELDRGSCAATPATSPPTRPPRKSSWRRGRGQCPRRQAAGAGRGLDPQGRGGPPHAQRGRIGAAGGPARTARAARREALGSVRLDVPAGQPHQGKIVAELTDVEQGLWRRTIVRNFSATILRGDKVGLIGPNGAARPRCSS